MGPDLLFVLELKDGSRIWVAVQSKYAGGPLLSAETLRGAMRSVTPSNYFKSLVRVFSSAENGAECLSA
ncbi:hypothetical protein C8J57DRAFT_1097931 [Mycena rebaudengoi]|nr:hypothetical protein C8J57DRAFT_1097931 [Mycena rebaudengoi]